MNVAWVVCANAAWHLVIGRIVVRFEAVCLQCRYHDGMGVFTAGYSALPIHAIQQPVTSSGRRASRGQGGTLVTRAAANTTRPLAKSFQWKSLRMTRRKPRLPYSTPPGMQWRPMLPTLQGRQPGRLRKKLPQHERKPKQGSSTTERVAQGARTQRIEIAADNSFTNSITHHALAYWGPFQTAPSTMIAIHTAYIKHSPRQCCCGPL